MLDSLFTLSNILTVIITAICTWGTTFLFHRQKKEELQIANEAERSRQWKELYEESQRDSARKDHKIDELRNEINELRNQLINLRQEVQLNTIYRCSKINCPDRDNPQFTQRMADITTMGHCSHKSPPAHPVPNDDSCAPVPDTPSVFTSPSAPVPDVSTSVSVAPVPL